MITRRGFGVLMVVGGQYNGGGDPTDSSLSLSNVLLVSCLLFW